MTQTLKNSNLILVIEDSDEDYFVAMRAFEKAGMTNPVHRCKDGQEGIDFLMNEENTIPAIILLDLNLPKKTGHEVLDHIKQHKRVSKVPVVVLTTSSDERDIDACYAAGANSYVQKPVDIHGFIDAIKLLKHYWFEIVILPVPGQDKDV
jgi:CheY-like chemotaxis protein